MSAAQFYDQNGELRIDGTLVGGGGSRPARNVGQAEFDFTNYSIPAGGGHVPLVFSDGDATMVDLTDPTYPNVVMPGIYAFVVTQILAGANNALMSLLVDDNYYSIKAQSGVGAATADLRSICVVWFCDANDPFQVSFGFGSTEGDIESGRVFVQKIA